MVDFKKLTRKARIKSIMVREGRAFVKPRVGLHPEQVAALTSYRTEEWSHADTARLAKFFGFASRMHDLLEALHREAQLHGRGDVEVATLLKEIDAACFND